MEILLSILYEIVTELRLRQNVVMLRYDATNRVIILISMKIVFLNSGTERSDLCVLLVNRRIYFR